MNGLLFADSPHMQLGGGVQGSSAFFFFGQFGVQ
jgi:hypothetical protein